jgi:sugar phosphate permease
MHRQGAGSTEALRKRWIIWASLMAVYIIGYFHRVAPAVIAKDLMGTFKTSGALLGSLSAIYFYVYAAMQIPSGILADTIGPRKTVTIGALIMGLGTILFALAPSLTVCFTGRFLVGLGVSVMMVNAMRVCVEWFKPNEMGLLNGLITTVGALGGLLAATPLALLSEGLGWRTGLALIGVVSILLAWNCWVRVRNKPEDCGFDRSCEENAIDIALPERIPGVWRGIETVFKNRYTWPPFFGFFCFYSTLMAYSGLWGMPYLTQVYGFSNRDAANYMMVVSLGLLAGCPLAGYISDRVFVRRKLPYLLFSLAYTAVWAVFCFLGNGRPPVALLYPISFLMGFCCSGFCLSLISTKEVNPGHLAGIAMGTTNTGGFLGAAILQVLLGKVLDFFWDGRIVDSVRIYPLEAYRIAFLICLGVTFAGVTSALFMKETYCRSGLPGGSLT